MWQRIAHIILKNRIAILVVIGIISVGMGFMATQVKIRYDFAALLPATDSTLINYKAFKQQFGEDGDVLIIGIEQEKLFTPNVYNAWYQMGEDIRNLDGIEQVISSARCYHLVRNDSLKRFDFKLLKDGKATSQAELDSIKQQIIDLKFYDKMLWDNESHISVMAITMSAKVLDSKKRVGLTNQIIKVGEKYEDQLGARLRYSGMPYIRSLLAKIVESEMFLFILYALLVTALIMFVFFRSFKVVLVAMLVVAIGSLWSIGFVSIMGFQLSILTGLVPPLIIVIGVANCIFLLNKYHTEYRLHGNKIKGLQRVVRKVGKATLLTNATTAAGFATFTVVESSVMKEFGIVAASSIMCIFVLSLLLVPIVFSFLKEPKARHVKHLDRKYSQTFISKIVEIVLSYRSRVYWFFGTVVVVGIYGITLITSDGKIVDDFPEGHHVLEDLTFFENHLNGVMPFEIEIDALKPGKAISPATLKRIDQLEEAMAEYPEFSRAVSVAEIVKSLKQAYYGGIPSKYGLPNGSERGFILSYANNGSSGNGRDLLNSFIDSSQQVTRVSFQMKDVGTENLENLLAEIQPKVDSIFNPDKYETLITGTAVVYLRGTEYLVKNLFISLGIAVVLISLLMAYMFRSWRMVGVSLIPNIIPLILTGALMGFLGITIKPSTILVFSIAFGISVDDTIHFLAKYRQELEANNWKIKRSVILALREVGISMAYTSIVLFFGFSIFNMSTFGGTKALGLLVSITLLVAMFSNLILLPSLLLTLERSMTIKYFKNADLDSYDPEDDPEKELSVQNHSA